MPAVRGAVLLSPTLRWSDPEHLRPWVERGTPLTVFVPEHDEFLTPVQAVERFGTVRLFSELVTRLVPQWVEPLEPDPVGVTLEQLHRTRRVLAVAGGPSTYPAIRAALLGGWVNALVTDLATAEFLVEG